jgi:glycine/D-amino acid oxidase-like deaminating enzyme
MVKANGTAGARTVRRHPRDPGPAAWDALLGPRADIRRLDARRTADWVVIGAGFAGLAAARRLKQLRGGDRIVVLEASRVGQGPAGRNTGFMIDVPHDLASEDYGGQLERDAKQTAMNREAIAFAGEAARDYGLPEEAFERSGKINAAASEKGLRNNAEFARHLDRLGESYTQLDAEEMRRRTGSEYFLGGLYTPGAAMLQPAMYVRGLADGLARDGVDLYEDSPVTEMSGVDGDWRIATPHGAVTAPKVVLAVNGHAQSFGYYDRQLMHVFTYASMTRALTPDEVRELGGWPRWGATPADPMGTTVRRISGVGGDRIVVRNRFTYDPSMEVSQARLIRVARDHDASFRARFPTLRHVEMAYRWGGRLCLSWNGVPAFGEVEAGVFSACCQNGLGTAKGTLAGIAAAELATRSNAPLARDLLASDAPKTLPPEPIAWLGANATMRWREFKAGREK